MKVIPLKKKVLVAENKDEVRSESGLYLEDATSIRESRTGTVLAVGPDVTTVAVGDKILLEWNKAAVIKVDGAQRVIIEEEHIVAVFDQNDKE